MKPVHVHALARVLQVALAVLLVTMCAATWLRVLRPEDRIAAPSEHLRRVDWHGALATDGSLAVVVRYRFRPPADGRELPDALDRGRHLSLPEGASRVRIDGAPTASSFGGRTVPFPDRARVEVAYEIPRAARRVGDRVLLDQQITPPLGFLADDYGHAEVRAVLTIGSGPARARGAEVQVPGARLVRVERAGSVLAVTGAVSTYDESALVALLPRSAAPGATTLGGDDSDPHRRFTAAAAERAAGRIPDGVPEAPVRTPLITAVLVTVELVAIVAWLWLRRRRRHRRLGAATVAPVPTELAGPPEDVDPDLVAILTARETNLVATTEAVAAAVLGLADRGVIRLESLDSRRFLLRIPAEAIGANGTEALILRYLRRGTPADAPVTRQGPPLWDRDDRGWVRAAEREMHGRAQRRGLVTQTLSLETFVPAIAIVPWTALLGSGADSRVTVPGTAAFAAAHALAILVSRTAPLELTGAGLAVRERGRAFARYLRGTGGLRDLGAPALLTRGPYLVYGVAVGEAPVAAGDAGIGRTLPAVDARPPARAAIPAGWRRRGGR